RRCPVDREIARRVREAVVVARKSAWADLVGAGVGRRDRRRAVAGRRNAGETERQGSLERASVIQTDETVVADRKRRVAGAVGLAESVLQGGGRIGIGGDGQCLLADGDRVRGRVGGVVVGVGG